MFTVFGYLSKRVDLSRTEFIDHYENRHIPLILSLAPAPDVYRRHYVQPDDQLSVDESALGFDVITELGFIDRTAFLAWIAAVSTGEPGARVAADEERFLDRSRTRSCVMEDRVTA